MKITDISNSCLTEITSDEAANVNGGSGFSPILFDEFFYGSLGSSTIATHSLKNNPNKYTLPGNYPNFQDSPGSVDFGAIDRHIVGGLSILEYL